MPTQVVWRTQHHFYGPTAKNVYPDSNHEEAPDESKCPEGHSTKINGLYSLNISRL